ncbi:MAG TPA: hypothetical protein P5337_10015 [Aestuariivirga sp.]|nr:hypothetical protein [Aestuariivirga sp.]
MVKSLIFPPPPPPPASDTITVTASRDFQGSAFFNIAEIQFAGFDYTHATFSSIQFGPGLIADNLHVTGDDFRNFINVHLTNGDTEFSAANWTFSNWVPYNPYQNDQVTIYGSAAADHITGSSQADGLIGGDGDDVLVGLDGRDQLIGGRGYDTLIGGDGDDIYRLDTVDALPISTLSIMPDRNGTVTPLFRTYDKVIEEADGGIDTVTVYRVDEVHSYALPNNVENGAIIGTMVNGVQTTSTMGAFELFGNGLANTLTGNNDVNVLGGREGADTLLGFGGNDTLDGGRGKDILDGGDGIDTASYASAESGVTVSLAITESQNTGFGNDTLISIENLIGSQFDDTLIGNDGDNRINGAVGRDNLIGGRGADVLQGGGGGDVLSGGAGSDRLVGGGGNDTLSGGGASDTFIFAPNFGKDTIADFTDTGGGVDDVIDATAFGFVDIGDIARSASGLDLVLNFGSGNTITIADYLATHSGNDILDDILGCRLIKS